MNGQLVLSLRSRRKRKAWGEPQRNPRILQKKQLGARGCGRQLDKDNGKIATECVYPYQYTIGSGCRPFQGLNIILGLFSGARAPGFMLAPATLAQDRNGS